MRIIYYLAIGCPFKRTYVTFSSSAHISHIHCQVYSFCDGHHVYVQYYTVTCLHIKRSSQWYLECDHHEHLDNMLRKGEISSPVPQPIRQRRHVTVASPPPAHLGLSRSCYSGPSVSVCLYAVKHVTGRVRGTARLLGVTTNPNPTAAVRRGRRALERWVKSFCNGTLEDSNQQGSESMYTDNKGNGSFYSRGKRPWSLCLWKS